MQDRNESAGASMAAKICASEIAANTAERAAIGSWTLKRHSGSRQGVAGDTAHHAGHAPEAVRDKERKEIPARNDRHGNSNQNRNRETGRYRNEDISEKVFPDDAEKLGGFPEQPADETALERCQREKHMRGKDSQPEGNQDQTGNGKNRNGHKRNQDNGVQQRSDLGNGKEERPKDQEHDQKERENDVLEKDPDRLEPVSEIERVFMVFIIHGQSASFTGRDLAMAQPTGRIAKGHRASQPGADRV